MEATGPLCTEGEGERLAFNTLLHVEGEIEVAAASNLSATDKGKQASRRSYLLTLQEFSTLPIHV